jgi:hypothetical protein
MYQIRQGTYLGSRLNENVSGFYKSVALTYQDSKFSAESNRVIPLGHFQIIQNLPHQHFFKRFFRDNARFNRKLNTLPLCLTCYTWSFGLSRLLYWYIQHCNFPPYSPKEHYPTRHLKMDTGWQVDGGYEQEKYISVDGVLNVYLVMAGS